MPNLCNHCIPCLMCFKVIYSLYENVLYVEVMYYFNEQVDFKKYKPTKFFNLSKQQKFKLFKITN